MDKTYILWVGGVYNQYQNYSNCLNDYNDYLLEGYDDVQIEIINN